MTAMELAQKLIEKCDKYTATGDAKDKVEYLSAKKEYKRAVSREEKREIERKLGRNPLYPVRN
jgi:hypothetical protein